jgi:hypothetical protein
MSRHLVVVFAALFGCPTNDTGTEDTGEDSDTPDTGTPDTDAPDTDATDTDTPGPDPLDVDDDGDGFSENEGDCDDADRYRAPDLVEICENGIDDDCDGVVDDLATGSTTLGPLPYLEAADSPWVDLGLSVFVLEDFEDQTFPGGVSVSAFSWSSSFPGVIDSVDGDDGDATNGACGTCEAVWASSAVTFTFDPVALGGLPTHAGVVVTDAFTANVTAALSATSACASLGSLESDITFGDGSIAGDTAEDRFVGFISPAGMTSLTISVGGPLEVDHLQFGW